MTANSESSSKARIRRAPRLPDYRFVQISRETAQDRLISYQALGLLTEVLSRPDNWEVNVTDLRKRVGAGRDKVYSILRELRAAGYVQLVIERDEKKRVVSSTYVFYEQRVVESPLPEKPDTEKPDTEKPHVYIYESGTGEIKEKITGAKSKSTDLPTDDELTDFEAYVLPLTAADAPVHTPQKPAQPVKAAAPKPATKSKAQTAPKPKPEPKPTPRNLMFDAIVEAFGYDPERLTKRLAKQIGMAAAELKAAQYHPEDVRPLYAWCRRQGWGTFSVNALAKFAPEWLAQQQPRKTGKPALREADPDQLREELS
jgi:hypothetical protein